MSGKRAPLAGPSHDEASAHQTQNAAFRNSKVIHILSIIKLYREQLNLWISFRPLSKTMYIEWDFPFHYHMVFKSLPKCSAFHCSSCSIPGILTIKISRFSYRLTWSNPQAVEQILSAHSIFNDSTLLTVREFPNHSLVYWPLTDECVKSQHVDRRWNRNSCWYQAATYTVDRPSIVMHTLCHKQRLLQLFTGIFKLISAKHETFGLIARLCAHADRSRTT